MTSEATGEFDYSAVDQGYTIKDEDLNRNNSITVAVPNGPILILRPNGTMELGSGLSAEEATQITAKILVEQYGAAITVEMKSLRAQIETLQSDLHKAERGLNFHRLRQANDDRQLEWDTGTEKLSPLFRAVEMSSEFGEVAEQVLRVLAEMAAMVGKVDGAVQKLERERLGIAGKRVSLELLENEIGDLFITADLLARAFNIDSAQAIRNVFNAKSAQLGFKTVL